jgi:membrane peptidoglycan carboxypeptidase
MLANAASLIICGLLAGLVVAAAAFPAAALTGLAAKAGAEEFDSLPSDLEVPHAPQVTNVYASDGTTLITSLYDENRRDVPFTAISKHMIDAVVATEDQRFYMHNGVDPKGVLRAFVADRKGESQQGASTLTMQYVRLAISYSADSPQAVVDATEKSNTRKLREMHLAIALEKDLTRKLGSKQAAKNEILDRYLNIAPFGHQAFGIYAASQVYFSTTPDKLTIDQAALLAGLFQATTEYDPMTVKGKVEAQKRRDNYVLPNMLKLGYITQAEFDASKAEPVTTQPAALHNGCTNTTHASWAFFCDYVERWWYDQPAFGADQYARENQLLTGGYRIVTSLNVKAQAGADAAIAKQIKKKNRTAMILTSVEPGSGYVDFVAVSRTYSNDDSKNPLSQDSGKAALGVKSSYPNTTLPVATGGGNAQSYQFGSTFKMFTMLSALYNKVPLAYTINAPTKYQSNFAVGSTPSPVNCSGYYCPGNAGAKEAGKFNLWTGFGHSVNTFFVPLEDRIGMSADGTSTHPANKNSPIAIADRLGMDVKEDSEFGSFTLGVTPTYPIQMSAAYAAVAAGGVYCQPSPVKSITDSAGNSLSVADKRCTQALDPKIADTALDAARCPVGDQSYFNECHGSGTAPYAHTLVGRPVAGKTGTTDVNQTESLILMTPQLSVAGIVVDPDSPNTPVNINRRSVNLAVINSLKTALKGQKVMQFRKPDRNLAYGTNASVPGVECLSVGNAVAKLKAAGFRPIVQVAPQSHVSSKCQAGQVAKSDPSGLSKRGVPVALFLSNGKQPDVPNPGPSGGPSPGPGPGPGPGGGGPGGGGGNGGVCAPFVTCKP